MESTVSACRPLEGRSLERCVRALAHRRPPEPADLAALDEELRLLLSDES
jgi:hypothetical protein